MRIPIKDSEIADVKKALSMGASFINANAQFVKRADGAMFRYDFHSGEYKFFYSLNSFAKEIVKFKKTGA